MSESTLPTVFHLKRNGELLAILESCGPSGEMFWLSCQFRPTPLFADVEPLYRQASESEDIEEINRIDDELLELGVVLIDVENDFEIRYFYLIIHGNTVTLRYAEPPYLE
jgi:hypothetical protein